MSIYCFRTIIGGVNTTVFAAADTMKLYERTSKKFLENGAEYANSVSYPSALELLTNENVSGFKKKVVLFKHASVEQQNLFIEKHGFVVQTEQAVRNSQTSMIQRHEHELELAEFKSDIRTIAEINNDEENGLNVIRSEYKSSEDINDLRDDLKSNEVIVLNPDDEPIMVATVNVHNVTPAIPDPIESDMEEDDEYEDEHNDEDALKDHEIELLMAHREMLSKLLGREIEIVVDGEYLDDIETHDSSCKNHLNGAHIKRSDEEDEVDEDYYRNSKEMLDDEDRAKLKKRTLQDFKAALSGPPVDRYGREITNGKTPEEVDRELGMSEELIEIRKKNREQIEKHKHDTGKILEIDINKIVKDAIDQAKKELDGDSNKN